MANTSLWIDGRMAVNGRQSHVNLSNPIALHDFIRDYLAANPTLITGVQTLAQVLDVGNVTGAFNIEVSNGQVIKAASGGSQVNLRAGGDSILELSTDNGVLGEGGLVLSTTDALLLFNNTAINLDATDILFSLPSGLSYMGYQAAGVTTDLTTIPYNIAVATNVAGNIDFEASLNGAVSINSGVAGTVSTSNIGVDNSVLLGGIGITAKTANTAYANQLGLNASGSAFETLIDTATLTADRTAEFPDASGVVNLTRYIAVNTPTVHTATTGEIVGVTTGAGALVVNLPSAVVSNQVITIKKMDNGAGAVTVTAAGAELIDAANTYGLVANQYDSVTLVSNGTGWMITATV